MHLARACTWQDASQQLQARPHDCRERSYNTYSELTALVQAIAEELNAIDDHIWTAVNGYSHLAYLQAEDDRRLSLRTTGYRFQVGDRLEIGGSYRRKGGNYGYISSYNNPPEIGVTSSRPLKALAKDIKRRFLPKFHEFYELAMERKRQHEEYMANQEKAGELVVEAFPYAQLHLDGERVRFGSDSNGTPWGDVNLSGNGTVTIEACSVPIALAVRIGHLLREAPHIRTGQHLAQNRCGRGSQLYRYGG